jgi:hypothetical protein
LKPMSRMTSIFKMFLMLFANTVLLIALAGNAWAQYTDDLKDIMTKGSVAGVEPGQQRPIPIGNLGNVNAVVDLRGFVPMSFFSASAYADAQKNRFKLENFFPDLLRWYKIPTKKALLLLYFGDLPSTKIADDTTNLEQRHLGKTQFLQEPDAYGESASWCKVAYNVAKHSEALYQQIVGSEGFEAGEPTTVFFTDQSAFVILSLKYNSAIRRNSTGQVLVALEFSRSSRQYKTFYKLYSNELMSKTTSEAFSKTAPIVAKVLAEAGML